MQIVVESRPQKLVMTDQQGGVLVPDRPGACPVADLARRVLQWTGQSCRLS